LLTLRISLINKRLRAFAPCLIRVGAGKSGREESEVLFSEPPRARNEGDSRATMTHWKQREEGGAVSSEMARWYGIIFALIGVALMVVALAN
jgi:hypothetical protein